MTGRTKSDLEKKRILRREHDAILTRAAEAYRTELLKPNPRARRGLRTICKDFETIHFNETGKRIKLSYSSLNRQVDGGKTLAQASALRAWLLPAEEDVVVDFTQELARQGWPFSHRRLKEHVDLLCRARHVKKFPPGGVGRNWTARFILRHSDRLKTTDSAPLEDKRGRCANPETDAEYWSILDYTETHFKIRPETTFGSDEIGVQSRGDGRERVIVAATKKGRQHQVRSRTRENTTVIVTICADGTSTPPAVIFKGSAYQVSWADGNPLNAS